MYMKSFEKLLEEARKGNLESLRSLLFLLMDYIPPGIDNMILLFEDGQRSVYLSNEGVKSVMVARGEFLPFIESHMMNLSVERLKEKDLMAIGERLEIILDDLYRVLVRWLDHGLEDYPLYARAKEFIEWFEKVGKQ